MSSVLSFSVLLPLAALRTGDATIRRVGAVDRCDACCGAPMNARSCCGLTAGPALLAAVPLSSTVPSFPGVCACALPPAMSVLWLSGDSSTAAATICVCVRGDICCAARARRVRHVVNHRHRSFGSGVYMLRHCVILSLQYWWCCSLDWSCVCRLATVIRHASLIVARIRHCFAIF